MVPLPFLKVMECAEHSYKLNALSVKMKTPVEYRVFMIYAFRQVEIPGDNHSGTRSRREKG